MLQELINHLINGRYDNRLQGLSPCTLLCKYNAGDHVGAVFDLPVVFSVFRHDLSGFKINELGADGSCPHIQSHGQILPRRVSSFYAYEP